MLHLKVGDGKIILFCCDAWLGHTPLKAMFPNLFTVAQKELAEIDQYRNQGRGSDIVER